MKLSEIRSLMKNLPLELDPRDPSRISEYARAVGLEPGMLYQELEMESKYVDTHRDTTFSNTMVSLHSHRFYELLCCRNNCGAEYLVGASRYRLQAGDVIIIPPGVSHRPLLPETMKEPYIRDVVWISPEFAQSFYEILEWERSKQRVGSHLLRTAGTRWESLQNLFRRGVEEAEEKRLGWEAAVVGNTMLLICQLMRALDDKTAVPMRREKPELLDRVMAYIEENYAQRLTVSDAAAHFYVSPSTISHLFRQKMGVSFYRCVTQRRLIAAKNLIIQGAALEQVNERVGFSDYSTFYRAFRQEFGISPRQFRKLQETPERSI